MYSRLPISPSKRLCSLQRLEGADPPRLERTIAVIADKAAETEQRMHHPFFVSLRHEDGELYQIFHKGNLQRFTVGNTQTLREQVINPPSAISKLV